MYTYAVGACLSFESTSSQICATVARRACPADSTITYATVTFPVARTNRIISMVA